MNETGFLPSGCLRFREEIKYKGIKVSVYVIRVVVYIHSADL